MPIGIVAGVVLLSLLQPREPRAKPVRVSSGGRFSTERLLAASLPLCHSLLEGTRPVRLEVEPVLGYQPRHAPEHQVGVEGKDETGQAAVYLTWSADTGRLLQVSHIDPPSSRRDIPPLPAGEVCRKARRWLYALGPDFQSRTWRLTGPPVRAGKVWQVVWKANDRTVHLSLDVASGDLRFARVLD